MTSLFTVDNLATVCYLVLLECTLSVDNALALASIVHSRLKDPCQQRKALHFGMLGAYAFRAAAVAGGVWLLRNEWTQWLAAAYLLQMSVRELFFKGGDSEAPSEWGFLSKNMGLSPLASAVLAVEVMDIAFSLDSIAVTLTVSNQIPVILAGAFIGIAAVRFAARSLIKLVERFPLLEKAAFILVGLSGAKIIAHLLGHDVPEVQFVVAMFVIVAGAMVWPKIHARRPSEHKL